MITPVLDYGEDMNERYHQACQWFYADSVDKESEYVCSFRDVFQAKLDKMYSAILKKRHDTSEAALITALMGEVGNNCFDHNLGQWRDIPGCWFDYEVNSTFLWSVIADRGRGIYNSLKTICPEITSDQEALETAYTKVVSGRYPEKRGNGLKFVSAIMNHSQLRGLFCKSGSGELALGQKGLEAKQQIVSNLKKTQNFGTLTFILWEK